MGIIISDPIEPWDGSSLGNIILRSDAITMGDNFNVTLDVIRSLPINGCITGSVFLDKFDPVSWGSDIDVFVYSENDLVRACNIAEFGLKMQPGKGTERSEKQERWKLNRLYKSGLNRKIGITTYTFNCMGVKVNFTFKQSKIDGHWVPLTNCPSVLISFDMTIVMMGHDIRSGVFFDLRPDEISHDIAVPNPLRDHDCEMWTVKKWVRQFDRVVKYYERGYDTRPMAEFYLDMINQCLDAGSLFDSEESKEAFAMFSEEFVEKRNVIADWLEEVKEN